MKYNRPYLQLESGVLTIPPTRFGCQLIVKLNNPAEMAIA
jgi:hypothetical protein